MASGHMSEHTLLLLPNKWPYVIIVEDSTDKEKYSQTLILMYSVRRKGKTEENFHSM